MPDIFGNNKEETLWITTKNVYYMYSKFSYNILLPKWAVVRSKYAKKALDLI